MSLEKGTGPEKGPSMTKGTGIESPVAVVDRTEGPRTRLPGSPWAKALIGVAVLLVLLSVVRVITGADDISSSGTFGAALALAVPIGLAGLGGLWSERAGVVNIGLEGMLIAGTFGAGWIGYQHGPWAGLMVGVGFGALFGLLHAVATVTFGVDHIVSGVAINILGLGATQYLADRVFSDIEGGGSTQSPQIAAVSRVTIPGIGDPLLDLEEKGWLLISDLAALLRALTTGVSWFTVIAVALAVGTSLVLWRTTFGLRLRSVGEDPWAAESLGIKVYRYKYAGVVMSGALAGFGGAFLAEVAANSYREGQTGGRGFIGLAALIFGNWRPGGLAGGSLLFGYTDGLQLRRGEESVHALLLALAIALLAYGCWLAYKRRAVSAAVNLFVAIAVLVVFLVTDRVASDFSSMTPYVATLLVLALASQRLRPPAADGAIYRKGQGR